MIPPLDVVMVRGRCPFEPDPPLAPHAHLVGPDGVIGGAIRGATGPVTMDVRAVWVDGSPFTGDTFVAVEFGVPWPPT